VLSSRICLDQFLQRSSGGNYPAITPDQLDKLLIPFPNTKIQHILSSKLELARNQRFSNLAQTDELLKGIDEFVLETIGVHVTDGPKKRIFAIPLKAARDRFDADFNSPRFKTIRIALESGPCPSKQLKELCIRMQSGFAAGKQDQAFDFEQGVPHLRPLNFNIYGEISLEGTKFVPKQAIQDSDLCKRGEVLFNNTNSTELVGKSAVFELTQDCACSNHVTRLEVEASMNPHYLAAVLNALRRLGYLGMLSTNFNNQAGINIETLGNLKVPCPTIEKQDTIAQEINHRRDEARRLSNLVEKEWNAAKEWFEVQLLKEAE
jgi:type I restriction enzyme S subunit